MRQTYRTDPWPEAETVLLRCLPEQVVEQPPLDLVKRKAVYTFTCPASGKEFTIYGNRRRKFCSHACYIAYRFRGVRHG
ncbi:hypothetical protein LQE88_09040 [Acidaminococcus sp. NSJ-142]|nr:hypothetical protein [Acidaminococcus hominis]MCD2436127.1 hypothetical protein [Acidaminococcus hominis]